MKLQSSCVAGLLVIASMVSVNNGLKNAKWSQYHLPWACSAVHYQVNFVSTCSIFDTTRVLVSSDNFNEEIKLYSRPQGSTSPPEIIVKKFYQLIADNLYVYAGTNLMDPFWSPRPGNGRWKLPSEAQLRRAKSLYVAAHRDKKWVYKSSPMNDISRDSIVEYDHYGIAFNIGILSVEDYPFIWTPYVQPILVPNGYLYETPDYILGQENRASEPADTCITYSWSKTTNRIRYHLVTYLPKEDCLNVFCMWNFSSCDFFPRKDYHACFKSVTYEDVCPAARGAALYCPAYYGVFAILTTAPSCGRRHMPGVYTTLPLLIELFETIFNVTFKARERPWYDPLGLDQKFRPWG